MAMGESRVAGVSCKSCALGCGRALLWNALPVARAVLAARGKTQRQSDIRKVLVKKSYGTVWFKDVVVKRKSPR